MLTLISNGNPLAEISIKSLVGYMESFGIPVQAIYLNNYFVLPSYVIDNILSLTEKSSLVGFSLMSKDVSVMLPLVKAIRSKQGKPVVWGGIHPTALPKDSMAHCDFACVGEGEEPLRQLYEHIVNNDTDYSGIPNIAYCCNSQFKQNPTNYVVKSLDDLPFPDYKFDNSYYLRSLRDGAKFECIPKDMGERKDMFRSRSFMFYSQRGCKLACTYCSNSLYHRLFKDSGTPWYRYTSVDRVKKELRNDIKSLPYIKNITLNDDDFLDRDIEQLRQISAFLKDELKVSFSINATPKHVTKEKIEVLAGNGLKYVAMGVQSGSERILKDVYRRPVYRNDVLAAANILNEFAEQGVRTDYGFILDNPYETANDWLDSLQLLLDIPKPKTFTLYSLAFFPGTVLTKKVVEEGKVKDLDKHLNKMYHDDIKVSYQYFMFYINTNFEIPTWINSFLMSDFMVKSLITKPIRISLSMFTLLPKTKTMLKNRIKYLSIIAMSLYYKINKKHRLPIKPKLILENNIKTVPPKS